MADHSLSDDLQQALTKLQGVRDDIRVRLHLASLDLKQQWDALDPQVAEAEKMVHDASESAREKLHELTAKFDELRNSLASSIATK